MSTFPSRLESRALAALLALLVCGCGGTPEPAKAAAKPTLANGVERWFPLNDRTVYAFDTLAEPSGEKGMLVLEIRRPGPTLAELVVAGHVQRLGVDPSELRLPAAGYLLKEPLQIGAKFPSDLGEVQVTSITREAKVPAGNFTGCLETVETVTQPTSSRRTTTVFCPGVGIAKRRTEVDNDEGSFAESLALKSYGPKFEAFK